MVRPIQNETDLKETDEAYQRWDAFNRELLLRLFDNSVFADEYSSWLVSSFSMRPTWEERISYVRDPIGLHLNRLRSMIERLDLVPEPSGSQKGPQQAQLDSQAVFLVHGHDGAVRESVARLIEKLGLKCVILHEQENRGRTLIEKFEQHSLTGYAVVLLTPDDLGGEAPQPTLKPRARQNVVFELGYFFGTLGRSRVCALYKEGVEIPSDMSGVLYVPLDEGGAWQFKLAKEMKSAGLAVDLNLL